jgi:hypothetical protein
MEQADLLPVEVQRQTAVHRNRGQRCSAQGPIGIIPYILVASCIRRRAFRWPMMIEPRPTAAFPPA